MPDPYPRWRFFPAHTLPPEWVHPLVEAFAEQRPGIDSAVVHDTRMQSNDVLRAVASGLEAQGFAVERDATAQGRLHRPVHFGDEGAVVRKYEIDAFHPAFGVALEVEAGRATMGNAIYRDLIQASLMVDARYLALAVPVEYRYQSGRRTTKEPSYAKTYSVVDAIYGGCNFISQACTDAQQIRRPRTNPAFRGFPKRLSLFSPEIGSWLDAALCLRLGTLPGFAARAAPGLV